MIDFVGTGVGVVGGSGVRVSVIDPVSSGVGGV